MSFPRHGEPRSDFPPVEPAYAEPDITQQLWEGYMAPLIAERLGALGVPSGLDPETDSRPEGMHRVGVIDFGDGLYREALVGGLGEKHIALPGDATELEQSIDTARSLIMQMLASKPPGAVKLSVYNAHLTDAFASFDALGSLYQHIPPDGLQRYLDGMSSRHSRLAAYSGQVGNAAEPWHINLIMHKGDLQPRQREQLNTLVAAGTQYGSLITIGVDLDNHPNLHGGWGVDTVRPDVIVYDKGPAVNDIRDRCQTISREASKGPTSPELSSIMSGELWTRSARDGLVIPLGINIEDGKPYSITLNTDGIVHGLITGQTGSGKSNVLNCLIASLTHHYSPDEVRIDLLDYKMGIEFGRYAGEQYLPHARLVGEKIDNDPEFGIAALQGLSDEIDRRARRLSELGKSTYAELYDDPDNIWPQNVMIIDEFQKLLAGNHGNEVAKMMHYIARQGRAFGIHLLLATQNVGGIDAIIQNHGPLFQNFALRIATGHGTMLDASNTAADRLPRNHALINTASGDPSHNVTLWMPDASSPGRGRAAVAHFQQQVHEAYIAACAGRSAEPHPPRVFNSNTIPALEDARDFKRLKLAGGKGPRVLLADSLSTKEKSVGFWLGRDTGSNIAVIGGPARREEVNKVLHSAALSIAKQHLPNHARFSLVGLDRQSAEALEQTAKDLQGLGHNTNVGIVTPTAAPTFLAETHGSLDPADETSHYIIVFGGDSSAPVMNKPLITEHAVEVGDDNEIKVNDGTSVMSSLTTLAAGKNTSVKAPVTGIARVNGRSVTVEESGSSGKESLRDLMSDGPANGVHVIASFSSATALKEAVSNRGMVDAKVIGAYVAVGVQPNELSLFTPDAAFALPVPGLVRRNRATFYERAGEPRTVRLYAGPAITGDDEEDSDVY